MKKSLFYIIGIFLITTVALTSGLNLHKGKLTESLIEQELSLSESYSELKSEIDYMTNSTKKNHGLADFGSEKLTGAITNNFIEKSNNEELYKFFEEKYPTIELDKAVQNISDKKEEFLPKYKQWVRDFQGYTEISQPTFISKSTINEHQRQYLAVKSGKKTVSGEKAYQEMKKLITNK